MERLASRPGAPNIGPLMTLSGEEIKSPGDQETVGGLIGYLMGDREKARGRGVIGALEVSSRVIDVLALPNMTRILEGVGGLGKLEKELLRETVREVQRSGGASILERVVSSGGGSPGIIRGNWWENRPLMDRLLKAAK